MVLCLHQHCCSENDANMPEIVVSFDIDVDVYGAEYSEYSWEKMK
jgi:hypothetical protein